jgi:SAM-dependent methyltransferase
VWIPQLPRSLWWSHNAYYHRWLLTHLPSRVGTALDVGCGRGSLAAALARRAGAVDAVDPSPVMIEEARRRSSDVNWILGDVLDPALPLRPAGYDVVMAVSSLHHMPLVPGLRRLAELVRPGGLLAVVGLYRAVTAADHAVDAVALPANALVGAVLAAQGRAGKPDEARMPVRDPDETLAEIAAAAATVTPGALVRRRLFFRYSLLWRR